MLWEHRSPVGVKGMLQMYRACCKHAGYCGCEWHRGCVGTTGCAWCPGYAQGCAWCLLPKWLMPSGPHFEYPTSRPRAVPLC